METHGKPAILRSTAPPPTRRKIILFPFPFQGHITPMLQLANILHTQGFSITIIHTQYNSPNHSNYPHFTFNSISDHFSEIVGEFPTNPDGSFYVKYLNKSCVDPFKDCLARLVAESDEVPVACVITDAVFYFTQDVADELKIPRLVLRTSSLACSLVYGVLPFFSGDGRFNIREEDVKLVIHTSFLFDKEKLNGTNYLDWLCNLKIVLRFEQKEYVIDTAIPDPPAEDTEDEKEAWNKHLKDSNEVSCLMLASMAPDLQESLDGHTTHHIATQLKDMFQQQATQEKFQTMNTLLTTRLKDGEDVSKHVLKLKMYIDQLEKLGLTVQKEMVANIVLSSLTDAYNHFVMNYTMHSMDKTIMELHGMLKSVQENMLKHKGSASTSTPVLAIKDGGVKRKRRSNSKGKGKAPAGPKPKGKEASTSTPRVDPKDATCYHCGEKGHWRSSCKAYQEELKKLKAKGVGPKGSKGK